jgi:hypothetical protein
MPPKSSLVSSLIKLELVIAILLLAVVAVLAAVWQSKTNQLANTQHQRQLIYQSDYTSQSGQQHKLSLDSAAADLSRPFAHVVGYLAAWSPVPDSRDLLLRLRTPAGAELTGRVAMSASPLYLGRRQATVLAYEDLADTASAAPPNDPIISLGQAMDYPSSLTRALPPGTLVVATGIASDDGESAKTDAAGVPLIGWLIFRDKRIYDRLAE